MLSNATVKPDVELFESPFFFFSKSTDQEILYVSPSIKEVLGYSPTDVIGKDYSEFLDLNSRCNQDIRKRHSERFQECDKQFVIRVVNNSQGDMRVLKIQTAGKTDEYGNIIANFGIAEDVTSDYRHQVKLNRRLSELEAIEASLSAREKVVLDFVIQGRPNKSSARKLDITERAVEMIRARLVKKFGVESTAALVSRATELETLRDMSTTT